MGKGKNLLMTEVLKHVSPGKKDMHTWVFSSVDNCHYNYNSRYLFEYVKENLKEVTPYFVINDERLRKELSDRYGESYFIETNTAAGIKKVLSAGVWFTSAGLPVYGTNLKKSRLIINLWHGVPLKKIALLDPNLNKWARLYFKKIFSENYSCIVTTSKALIPVMAQSFSVPEKKIKVWGQPRNDQIFSHTDREEYLRGIYGELPEYKKVVLYAPTFRDYGPTRLFPFEDFDQTAFENFLEQNKMLLFIRTHIKEKSAAQAYLTERVRYLGEEAAEDVTGVLGIFDLLVTDYSSIYIDYLLTEKPLIFLPYDKEKYLKGRGMNFDYDEVTPGPKPGTMKEFLWELEALTEGKDAFKEERERVNRLFNQVIRPCCEDICSKVLKKAKELEKGN